MKRHDFLKTIAFSAAGAALSGFSEILEGFDGAGQTKEPIPNPVWKKNWI